jgi:hydrogenase nickel incorporation protein HypA/HybF
MLNTTERGMHELPVTQSILEIALRHAQQHNARRVRTIYVVIGQLSSIIDDSIQFYWDMIAEGTLAQGAKLEFRRLPAVLHCQDCGERYELPGGELACPKCESMHVKVISGEEFYLEAIDIEN